LLKKSRVGPQGLKPSALGSFGGTAESRALPKPDREGTVLNSTQPQGLEASLIKIQGHRSGKPLRHPKTDFFGNLFWGLPDFVGKLFPATR